jgi:predicted Zn-dependent protease
MGINSLSAKELASQINNNNIYTLEYSCRTQLRCVIHSQIKSDNEIDERERLENIYEKEDIFDTEQFKNTFRNMGFIAPLVMVKKGEVDGIILFQNSPRLYFGFMSIKKIMDETLKYTNELFNLCLPEEEFILFDNMWKMIG